MGKRILCQFNRHKWRHRQSVTLSLSLSRSLWRAYFQAACHSLHSCKKDMCSWCVCVDLDSYMPCIRACTGLCVHASFFFAFFFLLAFCTMSACICMAHSEWTEWRMVKTAAILCKFFFSFALFFFEPSRLLTL